MDKNSTYRTVLTDIKLCMNARFITYKFLNNRHHDSYLILFHSYIRSTSSCEIKNKIDELVCMCHKFDNGTDQVSKSDDMWYNYNIYLENFMDIIENKIFHHHIYFI
jgi:hypothetical protein